NRLEEGWISTPITDIPTDLYMWNKFLSGEKFTFKTTMKITALNFPLHQRKEWTEQKRDAELQKYFRMMENPQFLRNSVEILFNKYQKEKMMFEWRINELQERIKLLDTQKENLEQCINQLESEISSIHSTVSWRVTRPLRYLRRLYKH
ncbi:MAG: hypothetical protein AAGU32_21710, partial [Bacillota bacterium]